MEPLIAKPNVETIVASIFRVLNECGWVRGGGSAKQKEEKQRETAERGKGNQEENDDESPEASQR